MDGYPKYAQGRHGTTQALDFTSVSAAVTTAFGAQTVVVRISATSSAHYKVYGGEVSSTADSTNPVLRVGTIEYVGVAPGQRIAAVKASGGTITSADGRMTITEIA